MGIIQSSFGTSGKFKVRFPAGTEAKEGEALSLRFKRYAHDVKKEMVQHGLMNLPKQTQGVRIELEIKKNSKNSFKKCIFFDCASIYDCMVAILIYLPVATNQ